MCERFEDTSVIQIVASYADTLRPPLERHSRIEKNPTMTKIVLLWLLSKTIVNVSYYIVGHVPRTISVPCGLFLKKGGTILCVITGPCQPWYSGDLEKLLRVISSLQSANLHVPFPQSQSIRIPIRTGPRKYSVPSLMVSITR